MASITYEQPSEFCSIGEEIANSVTHGVGAILSVAGLVLLVWLAARNGNAWHIVSCAVYGTSLVLLYVASTLYHALTNERAKRVFRVFDHAAIYVLIAGTYTPFTLVNLRGAWGWALFGTVWSLTICSIVLKSVAFDSFKIISYGLYVLMGWMALVGIKPLLATLHWSGLLWLAAGGLFYTSGLFFFASKRIPFAHMIWHLFVMGGSMCHFFAVYRYVIPSR